MRIVEVPSAVVGGFMPFLLNLGSTGVPEAVVEAAEDDLVCD